MASIHGAGLVYGPIHQSSLIITGNGFIKWTGVGCPTWLFSNESHEVNNFKNDVENLAGEILKWLFNHEEKQNLKITSDNSFNDYILWIEEIASGKISVDLNEWVTKTAFELQSTEDWESNYKNFIKLNQSENFQQSLKLSA